MIWKQLVCVWLVYGPLMEVEKQEFRDLLKRMMMMVVELDVMLCVVGVAELGEEEIGGRFIDRA